VAVVGSDPVAEYVRLAAIPRENVEEVEEFLRRQESGSDVLAVLEREDQPIALLRIRAGEATLFSFVPSQDGSVLMHETYIGKMYGATITQVHAVESLADASASRPDRVEIAGSRLGGMIDLTHYPPEQRTALVAALQGVVAR
jgi:hypothetical protein